MKYPIDAIYENGAFRPLQPNAVPIAEGQRVRLVVHEEQEPEALRLAMAVYEGLSDEDIDEVERVALERRAFFRPEDID